MFMTTTTQEEQDPDSTVLLKAWAHASSKSARFGLQELVGTALTVPCGPVFSTSGLRQGCAQIALLNSYHKKRLAAVQTLRAKEHVFMLQNCASECVNNRTYRTLQETCDEGAPCFSGQGSEALIGSLHIQALPTNRQKTRTCCCTCSLYSTVEDLVLQHAV